MRRQIESLAAQAEYQRFELEATYLTLTSNVVVAAVQEASLRGQIAATAGIIRRKPTSSTWCASSSQLGAAARSDVLTQQATLPRPRPRCRRCEKQLAQTRDQLTALLGRFPNQEPAARFDLASLRLPTDLPLSLPSQLVEQRPDVRAAEAQLHAASANLGVAIANQLPQFSITGSSAPRRWASPTCSRRPRRCGASPAASRRRCSTPAHCCTRSAPRSRPSTRRRHNTAAP